ncbi:MAG: SOS response-associated peptidase [Gemmatimonadota bacterium]
MGLTRPELIDWSQFGVDPPPIEAHYNIPPGTDVITIRERSGGRRVAERAHWGLIPSFAKDPSIGNRMAIARADTAFERPSFRRAIMARRCLIPVDVFYEWEGAKGTRVPRQPWAVRLRGGQPFTLGGIWEYWRPDDQQPGVVSFAVLTTDPNAALSSIHDRMPVIIPPNQWRAWLSSETPAPKVKDLLQPFPSEEVEAWKVSRRVNDAKNDVPEVLEPVA